jgi:hypothetical protein
MAVLQSATPALVEVLIQFVSAFLNNEYVWNLIDACREFHGLHGRFMHDGILQGSSKTHQSAAEDLPWH